MTRPRIIFASHEVDSPFHRPLTKFSIKQSIFYLFEQEQKACSRLYYVFCSDAYLLELNQRYLQHDTYTDILTFDLTTPPAPIEAEIYISIDRVKENAVRFSVSFADELVRVIFHGALHLCGYRDHTAEEQLTMRKKEDFYLAYWHQMIPGEKN